MRKNTILSFTLGALALTGCRSDNNGGADGNGGGDGGATVKIQDVQNDAMAPGTPVSLSGVVVTAIDNFGAKTGDFWVEEPEGGAFSGVHVFKAPTASVAALTVGDIVNISGAVKSEFALTTDTTGRTVTELEPVSGGTMNVTKTGSGTVPAPVVVDALAIGRMYDRSMADGGAAFTAAWEQWEGVLVTVDNVAALTGVKSFGSTTPIPADNYSLGITGVAKLEGSLTDITASGIVRNTCFGNVTGVVDYFFDYLIFPRISSDFATGGTGCPAGETSMSLCTDTTDNDGNGFADCADDNCIVAYGPGAGTCRLSTTIATLDSTASASLPTTGLQVDNLGGDATFITAISGDGKNFWVATSKTASSGNGLYVFSSGTTLPTTNFAVGAKVTVIGSISDYKPSGNTAAQAIREFAALSVTVDAAATGGAPSGMAGLTAANLNMESMGRPYVGSLVTLANVKVTTASDPMNHNVAALVQSVAGTNTPFEAAGDIATLPAGELNKCYLSITGIWTYDVYNKKFALEPIAVGTGTGVCT